MADTFADRIELHRARGLPEAYAIRNLLQEKGIPAWIDNEMLQGAVGDLPFGWTTAPRILIDRLHEASARAILAEFWQKSQPTAFPDDDRCLACGGPMGNSSTCPSCNWSFRTTEADDDPEDSDHEDQPEKSPQTSSPQPSSPRTSESLPAGMTVRAAWAEVAAVLAVGLVPSLVSALSALAEPPKPGPYWLESVQSTVFNGCTIFLVLYLIDRAGDPWQRFGIQPHSYVDYPLGLLMFCIAAFAYWIHFPHVVLGQELNYFTGHSGRFDRVWMVLKYAVGAMDEELVFRAYLITRLSVLLQSRGKAVFIAAILFASLHIYQQLDGLLGAFFFGLAYGSCYLAMRRIWPLVIGHAFWNIHLESHYLHMDWF